jgi:twitching motility two-component system response regulator PilG
LVLDGGPFLVAASAVGVMKETIVTARAPRTIRLHQYDLHDPFRDGVPSAGNVMVIDDSMTVRTVIEATLQRDGYEVSSFTDGLAAMAAMSRGEVNVPDLLLLDIGLPKMDGYEVARILRGKGELSRTIIVMLTARDGILDRFRSRIVGASAFISKPFKVDYVRTVVRELIHTNPHQ